jgi:hypothetical protein
MLLYEQHPDLADLLAELDAEDAAGERGELIGRDDRVRPLILRSRTVR